MISKRSGLQPSIPYAAACLFAAFFIAGILTIHTLHWASRDYRQDEAMVIEESLGISWQQNFMNLALNEIHPPIWWLISDAWVRAFGHMEAITRFLPTLGTALTLAFAFRLVADLFNRQAGLAAIFFLGTTGYFQFFSHEYRSYVLMCLGVVALHFFFLRWVKHQNFRYALFYVATGVALLYTHYYAFHILAAQVLAALLLVRWNRGLLIRAFGLFFLIGLSFVGWVIPFLNTMIVTWPGGIWYSSTNNDPLATIYLIARVLNVSPFPIGMVLLLPSIGMALQFVRSRFRSRSGEQWRFGKLAPWVYLWTVEGTMLLTVFNSNRVVSSLTLRNLVILVPLLAMLVAAALFVLPKRLKIVAIGLIFIFDLVQLPHFDSFIDVNLESGPHRWVVATVQADYQPGAWVVIDTAFLYKHVAYFYYLHWRFPEDIPEQHTYHILDLADALENQRNFDALKRVLPRFPTNFVTKKSEIDLPAFEQFLTNARQVWYIRDMPTKFSDQYLSILNKDFTIFKRVALDDTHEVIGFARKTP